MTSKEQRIAYLKQYLAARADYPWIAALAESFIRTLLDGLDGMAGTWRTDYSECTYYNPQMIESVLVDLSTVEKVREFYEKGEAIVKP